MIIDTRTTRHNFPMSSPSTPRTRRRATNRSNKAGLPIPVQWQLLAHLEASSEHTGRHLKLKDLRDQLPELYRKAGSTHYKAVQNKYQRFKRLKGADPVEYRRLVASLSGSISESLSVEDEEESALDQEYVAEAQEHPERRAQPIMPTRSKKQAPFAAMSSQKLRYDDKEAAECSKSVDHLLSIVTLFLMLLLTSSFIHSLADDVIDVDLDRPEKNGGFFVFRVADVVTEDGSEVINVIRVTLPHVVDIRDYIKYKAQLVDDGRALLVRVPAVPFYLLHEHKTLFATEIVPCLRTEQSHAVHANAILDDESRQMKTTLLRFPDGIMCSNDFSAGTHLSGEQKVSTTLRTIAGTCNIEQREWPQTFTPVNWTLRILDKRRRFLKLPSQTH